MIRLKRYPRPLAHFLAVLIMISLVLSACNLPATSTPGATDPSLIYTAAAQTVSAQLTQSANEVPATPTAPPVQQPTATQPAAAPTNTPPPAAPTNTPVPPPATSVPVPCNRAEFVKDVTIPDGTEMAPGTEFVKTWRLRNDGRCAWDSSYDLVFHDKNSMGGPAVAQLTKNAIEPGETVDVSVTLKAPNASGDYEGDWILRSDDSEIFGLGAGADKFFWVKITVTNAINYNFLTRAKNAEWSNESEDLDFGDPGDDTSGVADYVDKVKLEDGKTYNRVLATYPEKIDDGIVMGIFPAYEVQEGDRFRAQVGFRANCENGKVRFQFGYMEVDGFTILKEWSKTCDGELKALDYDLSDLEGDEFEFVLAVSAAGAPRNDKAVWVDPRIEE